jgi:glucose/arabinose dehydrogenase
MGWLPQTEEMWGVDHGINWLGDEEQKEELDRIVEGGNYGRPYIYEKGKFSLPDQNADFWFRVSAKKRGPYTGTFTCRSAW